MVWDKKVPFSQFNQLIDPPELSENRFFDRMPSYTVWNFSTGLTRNQWSVFAYADNLFNEKYQEIYGYSTRGRGFYLKLNYSL